MLETRSALEEDIDAIHDLLQLYVSEQIVLPRTRENIRENLPTFYVVLKDDTLIGCVSIRDFGKNLFEVRSLAVSPEHHGCGAGRALVEKCINVLQSKHESFRLFALTYQEKFFKKLGFKIVNKELFPEKIWADCTACPKKDNCDEIAVLKEF